MSTSNDPFWMPPLEGGGDWLRFHPCPFPAVEGTAPWFHRLAGLAAEEVRQSLATQWSAIRNPGVRAFAERLVKYHPCGLLHSDHNDGENNAWLVLMACPFEPFMRREILERRLGDLFVAPPYAGPLPAEFDFNEVVLNFFIQFGGLRVCPPFISGSFHQFPEWPVEIEPDEFKRHKDVEWHKVKSLFQCLNGDELLLSSAGRIAWLRHDDRTIVPTNYPFEEFLSKLFTAGGGIDSYYDERAKGRP